MILKIKKMNKKVMSLNSAIRDSIIETSRRVGKHNLSVPKMKELMEVVERSQTGDEFTNLVREKLTPVAHHIASRNVDEIATFYADFPVKEVLDKVPSEEQDAVFQALSMTNMLLSTIQMVPPEYMKKIESMTASMMGMMQTQQAGGGAGGLNDLFKNLGGLTGLTEMESDSEEDEKPPPKRVVMKKKAGKYDRQKEFRDKLC